MDLTLENVKQIVLAEIKAGGKSAEIDVQDQILGIGLLDSMIVLGLISALEEKFNLVIDGDFLTVENFESIQRIYDMLADMTRV